ncbi:MAG: hypothetical protein ACLFUV_06945 [Methanomassiliicoccales archaeon]
MELISMENLPLDARLTILAELGYGSDGDFVIDEEGDKIIDPYIGEPVRVDNMLILPGKAILDSNPLSVASYLEDHGDVSLDGNQCRHMGIK